MAKIKNIRCKKCGEKSVIGKGRVYGNKGKRVYGCTNCKAEWQYGYGGKGFLSNNN